MNEPYTLIDPDQLQYAEQKFPSVEFLPVEFRELDKCSNCDEAWAQVILQFHCVRREIFESVCDGCLCSVLGELSASQYSTELRVLVPLMKGARAA